jgi:hypothetical protein
MVLTFKYVRVSGRIVLQLWDQRTKPTWIRFVPPNAEDKLGFGHALWLRMYHINLWHYMHWNRIKTDSCGTAKEMNLWHKRIEAKSTSHPG